MASEESKLNLESETYYFDKIRELKLNSSKISEFKDTEISCECTVDEIIEKMEKLNSFLQNFAVEGQQTIKEHLEYIRKRYTSFKNVKFECLFKIDPSTASSKKNPREFSKLLDYSVRDKLIGFVSKKGSLEWSDEKINDFIESIIKSNRI